LHVRENRPLLILTRRGFPGVPTSQRSSGPLGHAERTNASADIIATLSIGSVVSPVRNQGCLPMAPLGPTAGSEPYERRRSRLSANACSPTIDPMYVPRVRLGAGRMAADPLAVMREGMNGKVVIGKLALYVRKYLVAVRPHERGVVMCTLRHAVEIRNIDIVEKLNSVATWCLS
jgi:hypothetical protein